MHPEQYEAYKSGKAKADFEADLAKRKAAKEGGSQAVAVAPVPVGGSASNAPMPKSLVINVDGQNYDVKIEYPDQAKTENKAVAAAPVQSNGQATGEFVVAPLEGKFYLTRDSNDTAIKVGDKVSKGDTVAYVESMKVINAITSPFDGTVSEIMVNHGDDIEEDDKLIVIS